MITCGWKKMNIVSLCILPVFFLLCSGAVSCNLKKKEIDPAQSFTKIYDKSDDFSYTAVDIQQLPDGGYIILGEIIKDEPRPYVLRLDSEGNARWETSYDDFIVKENSNNGNTLDLEELGSYALPIADIFVFNEEYYFFCNKIDKTTDSINIALIKLSETNHIPRQEQVDSYFLEDFYVLPIDAKSTSDGHMLLFALDPYETQISFLKINPDKRIVWESEPYYFDPACTSAYSVLDKRFNFIERVESPGKSNFFYHGYLDYANIGIGYPTCFAITPLDPSTGSIDFSNALTVVPHGRPFIAMEWDNEKFYGARIGNGLVSFVFQPAPNAEIIVTQQFELNDSAPVCIKAMTVNDTPVVFFAGSAKNNRIVLYAYILSSEQTMTVAKEYFGHTHIYEAAALIETSNNGLAILGSTYIAGQLGRICLFKLSKTDLETILDNAQ